MIEGRTILLTGGARGVGRGLLERYAPNNKVVSVSRSGDGPSHENVTNVACDLSDTQALTETFDAVLQEAPDIDILINNAAVLSSRPMAMMPDQDVIDQATVNFIAPVLISKRVLKKMMRRRAGRIVNIVSMSHQMNKPGDSVYAATKAALESFGKTLNVEAHPYGVTVNNVAISAVETGMLAQVAKDTPETIRDLIPHGDFTDIDGIKNCIDFFCLDASHDVGGQTLYLGGV